MTGTNKKPSILLNLCEVRVFIEIAIQVLSPNYYEKQLPQGDGRPVLVIPGFGAGDLSTIFIRNFLRRLGYKPVSWGMGINIEPTTKNQQHLVDELRRLYNTYGRKISIVGWSLGGLYARDLARNHPEYVHSIVSMGTPFTGNANANFLYGFLNRLSVRYVDEHRSTAVGVRTISIYSRSDGMVFWRCSLEQESELTENIEVFSSHLGLGFNPLALSALARALHK